MKTKKPRMLSAAIDGFNLIMLVIGLAISLLKSKAKR